MEKGIKTRRLTIAQGPMRNYREKKIALNMYLRFRSFFTGEPDQRKCKLKQKGTR